jgi:hypothetical protein
MVATGLFSDVEAGSVEVDAGVSLHADADCATAARPVAASMRLSTAAARMREEFVTEIFREAIVRLAEPE